MGDLTPIPPDSRMARHILRMEDFLRRMRDSLPEQVRGRIGIHDASRGGSVTWFSDVVLSDDPREYLHYYRYYAIDRRDRFATEVERGSLRQLNGPDYIKVYSEDRRAWATHVPAMLASLSGLDVSVTNNSPSWRWDHRNPRPNGQPTYIPAYEFMVLANARAPFEGAAVREHLLKRVCRADHPLPDKHLFDWQQDTLGELLFHSYSWNERGCDVVFDRKGNLERAQVELFAGLPQEVTVLPGRRWMLSVRLDAAAL